MQSLARIIVAGALALMAGCSAPQPGRPGRFDAPSKSDPVEAIGSTRNARVAHPIVAGSRAPLTYLASTIADSERETLNALAPNVRIIGGLNGDTALDHAFEADGIDARLLTPAFIERAPNLVWVHTPSAGVDRFMSMEGLLKNDRIVLTNSRAVHGPAIADHAFAMLLTLTRNLRAWEQADPPGRRGGDASGPRPIALAGRTMLVVGIGGIGSEIAQRAHGFGMRVIATRRTDTPAPGYVERVGRPEDLIAFLPEADVVAICLPLTPRTDRLFNKAAFEAMKPGSYLINIARGRIVETDALLAALKSGHLAGACLDVTEPEPLPRDHPLWRENVVITPHVAAEAELTRERGRALFRENVRRFGAGESLLNVVDKRAGY